MKRLNDLTRKERFEYITSLKLKNEKHKMEDAEIQYLFENNTEAEIREWFETKAATISFEGADLISVYMHNRIYEMLKKGCNMTWVIFRYENGRKIEIIAKADGFDEALKKARKTDKRFCGGYVK